MTDKKNNTPKELKEIAKANSKIHIATPGATKPAPIEKNPPKAKELTKPTYEELLKRLEAAESQAKKPQDIETAIKFFEAKKKKITQLNNANFHLKQLEEAHEKTCIDVDNKDFESFKYTLNFQTYSPHRSGDDIVKISNPEVMKDCFSFIIGELKNRIVLLEIEIKQDF